MSPPIVTIVDVQVPADREQGLLEGFRSLNEGDKPEGFVRSELLRGQDGAWRIATTWRDRETLIALRKSGEPPAMLALLDRLGIEHSHTVFSIEQAYTAD